MNIFVDTNVFLDAFLNRDDGSAKEVLKFLAAGQVALSINDITIINIAYILRKAFSRDRIKEIIDLMTNEYQIVCADERIIADANRLSFEDFEDGVQYACAQRAEADLIITGNKRDFIRSEIDVLSPVEFAQLYIR